MPIKNANASRGLWQRIGGAWVQLTEASATANLWDKLGSGQNQAWQVYARTGYAPISGVTTWTHILSTDKNGPGSQQPTSATLGASQFAGLPDLRKVQLTWVDSTGSFTLEVLYTNFNDGSFNQTVDYGVGRNGTTGVLWSPAGHVGNAVQVSMKYRDADGFYGPTTYSNTVTL